MRAYARVPQREGDALRWQRLPARAATPAVVRGPRALQPHRRLRLLTGNLGRSVIKVVGRAGRPPRRRGAGPSSSTTRSR
jgi:hypothetical protein